MFLAERWKTGRKDGHDKSNTHTTGKQSTSLHELQLFTELSVVCAMTGEEIRQPRGLILICRNQSRKVEIPKVEVDEH